MTILSVAYGVSKFVMVMRLTALTLNTSSTVGFIAQCFKLCYYSVLPTRCYESSIPIMCVLALLNGWFQGMGYPPYAKNMVTWFSRSERGVWWSWWNVSHNLVAVSSRHLQR